METNEIQTIREAGDSATSENLNTFASALSDLNLLLSPSSQSLSSSIKESNKNNFVIPQHIDTDIIEEINTVTSQQESILKLISSIDDKIKKHAKIVKQQTCEVNQLNANLQKLNKSIKKVNELDSKVESLKNKIDQTSSTNVSISRQISGTLNQ